MTVNPPARAQAAKSGIRFDADSSAAIRFVGCYRIVSGAGSNYQIHLTLHRVGDAWGAQAYGPRASDGAGSTWTWASIDGKTFRISWHGIDSAMEFQIVRHGLTLVASGIEYAGSPVQKIPLNAHVQHIACPSPDR